MVFPEYLFSGFIGALAGSSLTLWGNHRLAKRNAPKLSIQCEKEGAYLVNSPIRWPHDAPKYPAGEYQSRWLRVRVTNTGKSTARSARVYIAEFKHRNQNGVETNLQGHDLLQLEWSLRAPEEPSTFDMPQGVSRFADVCFTIDRPGVDKIFPAGLMMPDRLRDAWKPGKFSLRIMVASDNCPPVEKWIEFSWSGPFGTLTF